MCVCVCVCVCVMCVCVCGVWCVLMFCFSVWGERNGSSGFLFLFSDGGQKDFQQDLQQNDV